MPRPLSSRQKSISAWFFLLFVLLIFASGVTPYLGDAHTLAPHTAPPPGYVAMQIGYRFRHAAAVQAWAATLSDRLYFSSLACLAAGVILQMIAVRRQKQERVWTSKPHI